MTAFNFPDAPTLNQVYQFYTWDSEKWISTIGGIPKSLAPTDPYISSVVLLMGYTGADASTGAPGMSDESPMVHGVATVTGNAKISTAQSKFGGASLVLDGSGDYVSYADHADFKFGTGQFTLEGWFRFSAAPTECVLLIKWGNDWAFYFTGGALKLRSVGIVDTNAYTWSPTLNQWYHIAVDRDASNVARIYVDGVMRTKTTGYTTSLSGPGGSPLVIGSLIPGGFSGSDLNGFVDEVRITKGVARYASDAGYTVPTAAFPRPPLAITGTPDPTAYVGTAYSFIPTTVGGTTPYTYSLAGGALPAGLTLNSSTGAVTGTPTTIGTSSGIVIRVTDAVSTTANLTSFSLAVAAGFTPASLTGLLGWWDASVYASLNLTGSLINSIADQSGGGRTASWAGSGKSTYGATDFNGRPAIVLSIAAIGGYYAATSFAMGTGNTLTAWAVLQHDGRSYGGGNDARILSYAAPTTGADWNSVNSFLLYRSAQETTNARFMRNNTAIVGSTTLTVPRRMILTVNSSGVMSLYIDGVLKGTTTVAGNWASGGVLALGGYAAGGIWSGPIAEMGITTGYSDATTVGQLDAYLSNKWFGSYSSDLTSYFHPGGTGPRTGIITATTTASVVGAPSGLIDGTWAQNFYFNGGETLRQFVFDLGSGVSKIINEFTWHQSPSSVHGVWQLEGSADNSSYTTFPETFSLGSGQIQVVPVTNTSRYRYYRLRQISGTTSAAPWLYEIEFKISN